MNVKIVKLINGEELIGEYDATTTTNYHYYYYFFKDCVS